MDDGIKKAVEAGLVDPAVAAEMTSSLSDDGQAPGAQAPAGANKPAAAAPQPAAQAPAGKSRSIF